MALLNVNRENSDAFYRYKMPALMAKVEGKGNGIKTVVVNMPEVAKALQRPPSCKDWHVCVCGCACCVNVLVFIGRYFIKFARYPRHNRSVETAAY